MLKSNIPDPAHKVHLGIKDLRLDVESSNSWIFGAALILFAAILLSAFFWAAHKQVSEGTRESSISRPVYGLLAAAIVLVGVGFWGYLNHSGQEANIKRALESPDLQDRVSAAVDSQLRLDLMRCTKDLAESTVEYRVLAAKQPDRASNIDAHLGYLTLGVMIGLILGSSFYQTLVRALRLVFDERGARSDSEARPKDSTF